MQKVIVHFNSALPHFTQLLTGLQYLQDKNIIDLQYRRKKFEFPTYIFKVEVDGRQLFFDMADSSKINPEILEQSDFYIKRMLLKSDYRSNQKILPFGLNYGIYYKNKYLRSLFIKDPTLLKYSLRFSIVGSKLFNIKNGIGTCELSKMESLPFPGKQIVFRSRLWDPGRTDSSWKKDERLTMNEQRIALQQSLKQTYGTAFKGGIKQEAFTQGLREDMLLSDADYHKKSYHRILRSSSIGIVNQGLEDSIGWKFGEYISHSLSVVTTPVDKFQLLGPLREEEHYLTYRSPEECLEKTDMLFKNDSLRNKMQKANQHYYKNWLHPGKKLTKIFELTRQ